MHDRRAHTIEIFRHVVVPETQRPKSLAREIAVARSIGGGTEMLSAVDLDDQPRLETDEIEIVAAERHLALELETVELLSAQRLPEQISALVASARMVRANPRDATARGGVPR